MKIINLFIAFATTSLSYGQIYFNELVDLSSPNGEYFTSVIYDTSDNTFWASGISNYTNTPRVYHFTNECLPIDTFAIKNSSTGTNYIAGGESSLFKDNSGHFLVSGQISHADSTYNAGVFKFNQLGDTIWVKEWGDLDYFDAITSGLQDTDSTYIFLGFSGTIVGSQFVNYWLVKSDTNGNILWQSNFGGGGLDVSFNVILNSFGEFILSGYSDSPGTHGNNDIYIVKTDGMGNFLWQKWLGLDENEGGSVINMPNGNMLVYGSFKYSDPQNVTMDAHKGITIEIDQNGNEVWMKNYTEYSNSSNLYNQRNEVFNSAIVVSDGIVLCGFSADSALNNPLGWIVKTDFSGNKLWSRRYRKRNNDNYLQDAVALPNGDLVFTGFVFPENAGQTQDGWLLRTNCLGFDGPPVANAIWHNGSLNTVVLENDSERFGDAIVYWGDGMSTTFTEFDDSLISHSYAVSGNYNIQLIVNACNESDTITISADATVTGLSEQDSFEFNLYPNPAQNQITIELNQSSETSQIIIQNLAGQMVYQSANLNQEIIQIDINEFARGTYLVNVVNDEQVITKKLIVN